jgi:hypothetical protein
MLSFCWAVVRSSRRKELIGVRGQLISFRNDLVGARSADGPRGRADTARASSLPIPLARDPSVNLSPTRVPPMSVTMASELQKSARLAV